MKRWILLGSCSLGVIVPALVALASGCSSSSGGGEAPAGSPDAGDAGANAEPTVAGDGAACTPNAHETVAAKVTLNVNWPATPANAGCLTSKGCNEKIYIWLVAHYDIDSTTGKVTGTTYTCGNEAPAIPLTALGTQSEGLNPSAGMATVQITFDQKTWTQIANTAPPTVTTGTIGGWNVGSSFKIDPTTSTYGLKPTSMFYGPTAVWPGSESMIPMADLADDDNDMAPGITAIPSPDNGNSLPATGLATTPPFAPQADRLYLALRTELSLYGTSKSCTEIDGTATAQLFNNHVIGCRLAGDAGDCSSAQWGFVDSNSTVYLGPGVKVPAGQPTASYAPPGIHGTFVSKVISTDADAGAIDCTAVKAAVP